VGARSRRHAHGTRSDLIMRILAMLRSLWRTLVRRGRAEESLDDELRAYVELLAAERERAGMTPAEARRRALMETGGVEQVKEATREAWIGQRVATFDHLHRVPAGQQILQSQFEGVSAGDARGAVVAVAVVGAAMLAASWLPARRAARLDPADVLRCD